jgi:hypothetical protein
MAKEDFNQVSAFIHFTPGCNFTPVRVDLILTPLELQLTLHVMVK